MVNLNNFEKLLVEAEEESLIVKEITLSSNLDGLYFDGKIALNKNTLVRNCEKACVLAEEIGHHKKNIGNILKQDTVENIKQEQKAREYAYKKLVPIEALVDAFDKNLKNTFEIADYLNVTEEFLLESLEFYRKKYGFNTIYFKNYCIQFLPYLFIYKDIVKK